MKTMLEPLFNARDFVFEDKLVNSSESEEDQEPLTDNDANDIKFKIFEMLQRKDTEDFIEIAKENSARILDLPDHKD